MRVGPVVAAGVGLGLLVIGALRLALPDAPARPDEPPRPRLPIARAQAAPAALPPTPGRDIFAYADQQEPRASSSTRPAATLLPATPLPPPLSLSVGGPDPSSPRLVGLVRRAGVLNAVLALGGEVVVVKEGERADGYAVVSIDEDRGVSLKDAAGTVTILAPPLS